MTNILHHRDHLPDLRKFKDNQFDLALVDPPFELGEDGKNRDGRPHAATQKNGKVLSVKKGNYTRKNWDKRPTHQYFTQLLRVCRFVVIKGGNHFTDFLPKPQRTWIVWDKVNGDSHYSDVELLYTNLPGGARLFRFMWNGMNQGRSIQNGHIMQGNKKLNQQRIHPTQTPIQLWMWILDKYASKGWKILDTHSGSASVTRACITRGFQSVAYETDKDYYNDSLRLIEETQYAGPVVKRKPGQQISLLDQI